MNFAEFVGDLIAIPTTIPEPLGQACWCATLAGIPPALDDVVVVPNTSWHAITLAKHRGLLLWHLSVRVFLKTGFHFRPETVGRFGDVTGEIVQEYLEDTPAVEIIGVLETAKACVIEAAIKELRGEE